MKLYVLPDESTFTFKTHERYIFLVMTLVLVGAIFGLLTLADIDF